MSRGRLPREAGQVTMISIVLSLLIVALLTATVIGFTLGGNSSSINNGPGVGLANDVAAQSSLTSVQTAASVAGAAGGYGSITASTLGSSLTSVHATAGPSTSPDVVSIANSGQSVTAAVYSKSDTCWYLWLGQGGPVFGELTHQKECQAQAIPTPPVATTPSSTQIGWQASAYPAAS
jgi:hypothetical protein